MKPEQLALPYVALPPDPQPKPDKPKAIAVQRKPPEREAAVSHPSTCKLA